MMLAKTPKESSFRNNRGWVRKFADAGRGIKVAMRGEASFSVHLFVVMLVVVAGAALQISATGWCLLTLCIALVLTAEMFNTALERLARAITRDEHPEIRDALDIASGAVLVAAVGAIVVGLLVLGPSVLELIEARKIVG